MCKGLILDKTCPSYIVFFKSKIVDTCHVYFFFITYEQKERQDEIIDFKKFTYKTGISNECVHVYAVIGL